MVSLLPETIVLRTTTRNCDWMDPLLACEADAVATAAPRRRAEFTAGRALARAALSELGIPPAAIPVGTRRQPVWPFGTVGSITHCEGFTAAAAARARDANGLGIDAEPIKRRLLPTVVDRVCNEKELEGVVDLGNFGPLLVFSAKEAVYKAWFPSTLRQLNFGQVVLDFLLDSFAFNIDVLVDDPVGMSNASGRWVVIDGVLLTAVVVGSRNGSRARSPQEGGPQHPDGTERHTLEMPFTRSNPGYRAPEYRTRNFRMSPTRHSPTKGRVA